MTRPAGTDHAWVVVVAWDDDSLDRALAALDRTAVRPEGLTAGVVVDVSGFRRLTSRTLEALLRAERLLRGRLVLRSANPAHVKLLTRAGMMISAAPGPAGQAVKKPA